jgi:hypothetical protein
MALFELGLYHCRPRHMKKPSIQARMTNPHCSRSSWASKAFVGLRKGALSTNIFRQLCLGFTKRRLGPFNHNATRKTTAHDHRYNTSACAYCLGDVKGLKISSRVSIVTRG